MKCKGFLFDLDGTLVDSLAVVERAWAHWAQRRGIAPDEVLAFIHGKQAITALRHFMAGSPAEEIQQEFYVQELMEASETDGITATPGALALLATLNELAIPWAIVTSGSVPVARARHTVAGLPEPQEFITAERVERGKPEPDPYLLGAHLLGLEPEECVVVEDAAAGILSGLAAGCHVIGVNVPVDAPRLGEVDMLLTSLEELVVHREPDGSVNVHRKQ